MSKSLPGDRERIAQLGHRAFVGGDGSYWEEIANLQFDLLVAEGLKPDHVLLDVACGALRAGRKIIAYLEPGNYQGLDKEIDLIILGVALELGIDQFNQKRPEFVITESFDFSKFSRPPDYALAQSLFTHLTIEDIRTCMDKLRQHVSGQTKFFATFFEADQAVKNFDESDALDCFFYTQAQMHDLAKETGWHMTYIGDWNHPRGQKLLRFDIE